MPAAAPINYGFANCRI